MKTHAIDDWSKSNAKWCLVDAILHKKKLWVSKSLQIFDIEKSRKKRCAMSWKVFKKIEDKKSPWGGTDYFESDSESLTNK